MKNYKYLVPLVMIVLMGASFATILTSVADNNTTYQSTLKEARRMAELEVIDDAFDNYSQALSIKDTLDVNLEIGQMYFDNEWYSEAIEWGKHVIEKYPEEPKAYDFLLNCYINQLHYKEAFALREQAQKYDAQDKDFQSMMEPIEYSFELSWDNYEDIGAEGNGYYAVMRDGKWGFCKPNGNILIKPQYLWVGAFSSDEGVAPVQDENKEFYYVKDSGHKKIPVQNLKKCTGLGMYTNGVLTAADNGVYGYYDREFNKLIHQDYTFASVLNGGFAAVATKDGWSVIDAKGALISKDLYEDVRLDEKQIAFRNDRAFVKKGGSFMMIDTAGKQVGSQTYDDCVLFSEVDSFAAVKVGEKWGFVDKDGNMIIEPKFDGARSFKSGMAAVKVGKKWGFVDKTGELVLDAQFDGARDFNQKGCAFIKHEEDWSIITLYRLNYND